LTELLVILLVVGAAMVIFAPALSPRPATPRRGARRAPARAAPESGALAELRERKARLLRGLRELEADREAGRVAEATYQELRRRDQAEAARVLQQIEALGTPGREETRPARQPAEARGSAAAATPRRRAARVLAWSGGVVAFGVILVFTMSRAVAPRAPGGSITGTMPGGSGEPAGGGAAALLPSANPARLAELERQIATDSARVPVLLEAGHLYIAEQRFDEAARVTVRALELNPEAAEAFAHIGVLLFVEASSHDVEDSAAVALRGALDAVNRATQLAPDLAEAWLFKGMIQMGGLRNPQAAAEAWAQYLKVAPPDADTSRISAMVQSMRRPGAP
jgi:tetratricopeptide (TPR) repeat protein